MVLILLVVSGRWDRPLRWEDSTGASMQVRIIVPPTEVRRRMDRRHRCEGAREFMLGREVVREDMLGREGLEERGDTEEEEEEDRNLCPC